MILSNCLIAALILRFRLKGSTIHYKASDYKYIPHFYVIYRNRILDFIPRVPGKAHPFVECTLFDGFLRMRRKSCRNEK
jgi:hypothetical protein